jgi:hypothetical protein
VMMRPSRLRPTRVYRFYRGGALIDRLRGEPGHDDEYPEDWVGCLLQERTQELVLRGHPHGS